MSSSTIPESITLLTAGIGGIVAWIIVHPFNTMAIRMNLDKNSTKQSRPSFVKSTYRVINDEGIGALYKGLSAGIVRQIFYATSRVGIYELLRDRLSQYRKIDIPSRILLGAVAGACSAVISCPAEVTLVRMSNDNSLPLSERRGYKNIADAARRIVKEEGITAFWRGCSPFVQRVIVVGVCQVATYDQFRVMYKQLKVPDGLPNVFCAAMSSGLLFSLVTMPLETAKNRMAFQKPDPTTGLLPYKSTFQTIKSVAVRSGVLALWNGFLPYYARCGGHTVLMFTILEQLRVGYTNLFQKK